MQLLIESMFVLPSNVHWVIVVKKQLNRKAPHSGASRMHKLLKTLMLLAALTGKTRHIYVWDGRYARANSIICLACVGMVLVWFLCFWKEHNIKERRNWTNRDVTLRSICKKEMISSKVIRTNPELTYRTGILLEHRLITTFNLCILCQSAIQNMQLYWGDVDTH